MRAGRRTEGSKRTRTGHGPGILDRQEDNRRYGFFGARDRFPGGGLAIVSAKIAKFWVGSIRAYSPAGTSSRGRKSQQPFSGCTTSVGTTSDRLASAILAPKTGSLPASSSRESFLGCNFTSTGPPGKEGTLQMENTGLRFSIWSSACCPGYSMITTAATAP